MTTTFIGFWFFTSDRITVQHVYVYSCTRVCSIVRRYCVDLSTKKYFRSTRTVQRCMYNVHIEYFRKYFRKYFRTFVRKYFRTKVLSYQYFLSVYEGTILKVLSYFVRKYESTKVPIIFEDTFVRTFTYCTVHVHSYIQYNTFVILNLYESTKVRKYLRRYESTTCTVCTASYESIYFRILSSFSTRSVRSYVHATLCTIVFLQR